MDTKQLMWTADQSAWKVESLADYPHEKLMLII